MKLKTIALLTICTVQLNGCNNFNRIVSVKTTTYSLSTNASKAEQPRTKQDTVSDDDHGAVIKEVYIQEGCKVIYKFPSIPSVPELPYKQLQALSPSDVDGLDRIQQQHIRDLRIYIARVRGIVTKARSEYLALCKQTGIKTQ
jgi:hypothetical protein